jgi:farnesyl-diphosphate farnesyltransferase
LSDPRGTAGANLATPPLLDHLLQGCSRTFALTIPLLNEPTRCEVTVAYLLFRIADIFEDSTAWPRQKKSAQLRQLAGFLEDPSSRSAQTLAAEWKSQPPLPFPSYLELLGEFPAVVQAAQSLSPRAWSLVATHTCRTCRGMSSFVDREEEGNLRLTDLADLRSYCYAVAGIVGEMLTELFLLSGDSLQPIASGLRQDAAAFGEGLQLVNILKDRVTDAGEGRYYLPESLPRAEVFALARRDLTTAAAYSSRLESARSNRGIVAFTALPVLLARATLDRVERLGPGAKISRDQVAGLVRLLHEALEQKTVGRLLEESGRGMA